MFINYEEIICVRPELCAAVVEILYLEVLYCHDNDPLMLFMSCNDVDVVIKCKDCCQSDQYLRAGIIPICVVILRK